jgi:hypothetical protein
LNNTDLSNQTDAEAALTALNAAISDVAAQDGYIGAQINTLNSISQVMSTQQENVVSAQNAIQATDYSEPDRHCGAGAGQQHSAGSHQAAAITQPAKKAAKPEKGARKGALFCADDQGVAGDSVHSRTRIDAAHYQGR